jgi:hypothetical protein
LHAFLLFFFDLFFTSHEQPKQDFFSNFDPSSSRRNVWTLLLYLALHFRICKFLSLLRIFLLGYCTWVRWVSGYAKKSEYDRFPLAING